MSASSKNGFSSRSLVQASLRTTNEESGNALVGGALHLLQQGLSHVTMQSQSTKNNIDDDEDDDDRLSSTTGIPNDLRGKRSAQVEYDVVTHDTSNKEREVFPLSTVQWDTATPNLHAVSSTCYLPSSIAILEAAVEQYCRDGKVSELHANDQMKTQHVLAQSIWRTCIYEHMCTMSSIDDVVLHKFIEKYRESVVTERVMHVTCRWRPLVVAKRIARMLLPWWNPKQEKTPTETEVR